METTGDKMTVGRGAGGIHGKEGSRYRVLVGKPYLKA